MDPAFEDDLLQRLQHLTGSDPVLAGMLRRNEPLTRERYLELSYPNQPEMTAEMEAELPEPFQNK